MLIATLLIIVFVVSLLLLPALALVFVKKYGTGWRLFFAVALLQALLCAAITVPLLQGYPNEAAIILPGILAGIAAFCGVAGLVTYALLFFLVHRPENWQRNSLWLGGATAVALLAWLGPIFFARSGATTNVDLHGVVADFDGRPVPNAEVHLGECAWVEQAVPVTDREGRFRVVANCVGLLVVERIHSRDTATDCLSWFPSSSGHALLTFDPSEAAQGSGYNPMSANRAADDPVVIPCAWRLPESVRQHISTYRDFPVDGRVVTFSPGAPGSDADFVEGATEGLLHLQFRADAGPFGDASAPVKGRLRITPVAGGIRITENLGALNAAPANGYEPSVETPYEDPTKTSNEKFFFYSNDRRVFGSLHVSIGYPYNHRTQRYEPGLEVRLHAHLNEGGGRVLLTHLAPYGN